MPALKTKRLSDGTTPTPDWADVRIASGLSIEKVARMTGINKGVISRIENRWQMPTPQQARAMLDCYAAEQREPAGVSVGRVSLAPVGDAQT